MNIEEILKYAESLSNDKNAKITLLFITRELKPGMSKNAKVLDKYDFKLNKAALSPDIASHFKGVLANQITSHASKDEIELTKYTVIDDDLDNKIYTYANNNAISFSKVINEHVKADNIKPIESLNSIKSNLWAYCIKVQQGKQFTYSFRKVGPAKITTNTPEGAFKKAIAMFDKNDGELRSFDGQVISFDEKIDCIYIEDNFYVFSKKGFESILGLEEEFKAVAQETLETIKEYDLVVGLEIIEDMIVHRPSIRKTLSKIKEKGNIKQLTKDEIDGMNGVLKKFMGKEFKTNEDGKIVIENNEDVRNFLRLLNDYYKQGMTTKKYYASESGNVVNPQAN